MAADPTADLGLAERQTSLRIMLVALAGLLFGLTVIFAVPWTWPARNQDFARENSSFLIWALVILAQTAGWPIVASLIVWNLRRVSPFADLRRREIVVSSIVFLTAALTFTTFAVWVPDLPSWLPQYRVRLMILSAAAIVIALGAAIGMWLVHSALRRLVRESGLPPAKPTAEQVRRLVLLGDVLKRFLVLLGLLLTGAIVGAGAERNAVLAYAEKHKVADVLFPGEYVVVYGLFLSALAALVYTPVHLTFLAVGRNFRERFFPPVAPDDDAWSDRLGQRRTFDEMLDLSSSTGATFKASVAALSPLIASLLALPLGD